jgi:hypothetical protein
MKKILKYLNIFNERHPEYDGDAWVRVFIDGTGSLNFHDGFILGTYFSDMNEFKSVCLNK